MPPLRTRHIAESSRKRRFHSIFRPLYVSDFPEQDFMNRVFASFAECVQDGVMSACGAFDTAPLERILDCLESRKEKYFDQGTLTVSLCRFSASYSDNLTFLKLISQDGNVVNMTQDKHWKLNVRRVLFTSDRFGVDESECSDDLEFYVVNKQLEWYLYPAKFCAGSSDNTQGRGSGNGKVEVEQAKMSALGLQSKASEGRPNSFDSNKEIPANQLKADKYYCTTQLSSGVVEPQRHTNCPVLEPAGTTNSSEGSKATSTPPNARERPPTSSSSSEEKGENIHEPESSNKIKPEPICPERSSLLEKMETRSLMDAHRQSSTSLPSSEEEGKDRSEPESSKNAQPEKMVDKLSQGNDFREQSQAISYKSELTCHTLCSNLEIGSFPGSLPF